LKPDTGAVEEDPLEETKDLALISTCAGGSGAFHPQLTTLLPRI